MAEKEKDLQSKGQPKDQKDYYFGGIKEFNLEQIETEVLNESIYLDVFAGSDLRLKTQIRPIEGALSKVMQLGGVHFNWNPETSQAQHSGLESGLIAQEVAAVMPELVRKDQASGMLAVNYTKLTSYLVEAIKDLSTTVLEQEKRIRSLEDILSRQTLK
jgi:hypothetical protein